MKNELVSLTNINTRLTFLDNIVGSIYLSSLVKYICLSVLYLVLQSWPRPQIFTCANSILSTILRGRVLMLTRNAICGGVK